MATITPALRSAHAEWVKAEKARAAAEGSRYPRQREALKGHETRKMRAFWVECDRAGIGIAAALQAIAAESAAAFIDEACR